jgi:mono/diheme cytochrome c family protein
MKSYKFAALAVAVIVALLVAAPRASFSAEDGAALFKTKCSMCHGPAGEGKPAMKMPAVKGTALTAAEISNYLLKGVAGKLAPHAKPVAGVNAEQAKAIADFVKGLK